MAKKREKSDLIEGSKLSKSDEKKFFAFIVMLLSVIGFLIAILVKRDDKYIMFYAKQSLVLFFAWLFVAALGYIIKVIQFFGEIVYAVLLIFLAVVWIFGMIYALSGEEIKLPLIGEYARYIKFD